MGIFHNYRTTAPATSTVGSPLGLLIAQELLFNGRIDIHKP